MLSRDWIRLRWRSRGRKIKNSIFRKLAVEKVVFAQKTSFTDFVFPSKTNQCRVFEIMAKTTGRKEETALLKSLESSNWPVFSSPPLGLFQMSHANQGYLAYDLPCIGLSDSAPYSNTKVIIHFEPILLTRSR